MNGDGIEEVKTLVSTGREQGFLTFDAVAEALSEVEVSRDQVEELHTHLSEQGIEVIARDEAAERGKAATAPLEPAAPLEPPGVQPVVQRQPAAAADAGSEGNLDSLRLYLRSIGQVDLLDAERKKSNLPNGSNAATWRQSGRWSKPTCASSSRSPRDIWAED